MDASATSTILMTPPRYFAFNVETARTNVFQNNKAYNNLITKAMSEFDGVVHALTTHGIDVITLEQEKKLPDAVFPNNWFSTHPNAQGKTDVFLYPMYAVNRQAEVNQTGLINALTNYGITVGEIIDFRKNNLGTLEGTGSMVLDRAHQVIYAAPSPRTDSHLVEQVGHRLGYQVHFFNSSDEDNRPIYHTNVMMSVAKKYVVICLESIKNHTERQKLKNKIESHQQIIIPISLNQIAHMCGNLLELVNAKEERLLIMSNQAWQHFTPSQLNIMEQHSTILPVDIGIIETIGGGGVRCMMAELFHSDCPA